MTSSLLPTRSAWNRWSIQNPLAQLGAVTAIISTLIAAATLLWPAKDPAAEQAIGLLASVPAGGTVTVIVTGPDAHDIQARIGTRVTKSTDLQIKLVERPGILADENKWMANTLWLQVAHIGYVLHYDVESRRMNLISVATWEIIATDRVESPRNQ